MDEIWIVALPVAVIVGIALWVNITRLVRLKRDRKLLQSVTGLNSGTRSERDLVLNLLKYGIPAEAIFHDLMLKKDDGTFSQIDVAVLTNKGIIVYEVKDFSGWIFGNGSHSHWTKVLAYGKQKHKFYNPIKQNNGHIKVLRKQLSEFVDIPFISIILFYGDCELKEINFVPDGTFLVKEWRMFEVLEHIEMIYPDVEYGNRSKVLDVLQQAALNGKNAMYQAEHIENINDMLGKNRIFD